MAGANTYGKGADRVYVGRNQLDGASLDRFRTIFFDYDEKLELDLAPHINWCKYVQQIRANVAKNKIRHIVSTRAIIEGGHSLNDGDTLDEIKEEVLFSGLTPDEVRKIEAGATYAG